MATKTYNLPTLKTASGNVQIKIYHEDAATSTINIDDLEWDLSPIVMPFEVVDKSQAFRFSSCRIKVLNRNNAFETNGIYNETYKNKTFVDIYKDGAKFWSGRLVWEKSKKKEWYKSASGLKYFIYDLYCIDKLEYLNTMTLADASYADDQAYYTIFLNIAGALGLSLKFPTASDWKITEWAGREYALISGATGLLKVRGLNSSQNLLSFVKDFCLAFGLIVYNLNGELVFSNRAGGTANSLADRDILIPVEKVQDYNTIDYIEIIGHIDFGNLYNSSLPNNYEVSGKYGTQNANDARRNFSVVDDVIFPGTFIFFDNADAQYPLPAANPNSGGTTTIGYTDFHGAGHEVESGMKVMFNYDDFSLLYDDISVILDSGNGTDISFYSTGNAASTSKKFQVDRQGGNPAGQQKYIYKIDKLVKYVRDIYKTYFYNETYDLKVFGIKEPGDLFAWDGKNLKAAKCSIDLKNNRTGLSLRVLRP